MTKELETFLASVEDGVFYIGHASALVRVANQLILCDPVWDYRPYGEYWRFFPEQENCNEILDRIDFCVISHKHADHYRPEILKKLDCPIAIMGGRDWKPDVNKFFEFAPLKWHQEDLCEVYFVPHAFNTIDSSVFFRNKETGYTIYIGSDNFLSVELLYAIREDIDRVDIAMVPYSFVHWWPFLQKNISDDFKYAEICRMNKQSIDQAYDFIKMMRPKIIVPFGNSLFYEAGASHILNRSLANPWNLRGASPMLAGDFILDNHVHHALESSEPRYYLDMLYSSLGEVELPELNLEFAAHEMLFNYPKRIMLFAKKINSIEIDVEEHYLIVNGLCIDLGTKSIIMSGESSTTPRHIFNFDRSIFEKWICGEITFEEAIGTRRFEFIREPDKYDVRIFEIMNRWL
jgi:hypothetical protein